MPPFFPHKVCDGLGEVRVADGRKKLGAKNTAKPLERDPGHAGAISMLKKMGDLKSPQGPAMPGGQQHHC